MLQRTRRTPAKFLKALAIVPLTSLLLACDSAVLDPAGDIARQQRDLIYISTGLMLLIIVPVITLIVVFAWRYRKGGGGTYDPKFDHSAPLELAIWSAPLLIIIVLGALTWASTHLLDPFRPLPARDGEPPLVVQVVSLDWKWLFIYPTERIASVNELVVPVGRPVRFDITSSNMMNTFYVPTMAGMIYAMPGMQSQLHAVLTRPVQSQGFSANYSGAGFSHMRFKFEARDAAGYASWVDAARGRARALDLPAYLELLAPSERVPVTHFSSVDTDLFRRTVERCIASGTPCSSEMLMRHGPGHETAVIATAPQDDRRE